MGTDAKEAAITGPKGNISVSQHHWLSETVPSPRWPGLRLKAGDLFRVTLGGVSFVRPKQNAFGGEWGEASISNLRGGAPRGHWKL